MFILENVDFRVLSENKTMFKDEKCIILSHDDLTNGHDVFPLKLLHIRNHSTLSLGKDILKDIDFKKSDLLKTMELELRTKMVQLREDFLSDSFSVFVNNILYFVQVIWEGVAYIHGEYFADVKALESFVDDVLKCD
ncbi:hypothetical protein KKG31_07000 [Patescibacteria group bacterium]|nr:hypothetical protein [Patescibacteria group bacterium]MBU1758833.1 hypothetical protein [Patescibacteria group bacterium]